MYENIMIVCNGTDYNEKKIIQYAAETDYLIAADGALNLLNKLKLTPHFILGDMDSVAQQLLNKYQQVAKQTYPANKDDTDSELAIRK